MPSFWKLLKRPITVLAPMEDVTDFVFREIIADIGKPDVLFTEFTNADALSSEGRKDAIRKLLYSEKQRPIVAQIWGATPNNYFKAAQYIEELKFDGIDINMGCPDKKVMKVKSGASLITDKELALELIQTVKQGAPKLPLSVKTRLSSNKKATEDWVSFLLEQKLDALIIHCRSTKEKSKGEAHWDEIGKAVKLKDKISPETTIIGNGDVKSYAEVLDKHKTYGVDGVMIGRGVFSNPWVFERKLEPTNHNISDYIELLRKHLSLYNKTWGDTKNFENMKKFFKVYINNFRGSNTLRKKLMKCHSYEEVTEILEKPIL
jgi:tRNA-dihydrouridine synthase